MARARNIKPGFFSNDQLAECDLFARLLFIGLWTIADRAGRLEDRPKRIKGQIFPYDNLDCDAMLEQLAKHGFITRYQVNGEAFIQVTNWDKHQNPHVKEQASTIPPMHGTAFETVQVCDEHQTSTMQAPDKHGSCPADSLIPDSLIPDSLENPTQQSVDCRIEPIAETTVQLPVKTRRKPAAEQDDFVLPDWVPADAWADYVDMRKARRKAMTGRARDLVIVELLKLMNAGHSPRDVLAQSTRNSWTDVYAVKQQNGHQAPQQNTTAAAMDLLRSQGAFRQ